MANLVEDGEKPENAFPCYVRCPYCKHDNDYWRTGMNTRTNEKVFIKCLNPDCGLDLEAVGTGSRGLQIMGVLSGARRKS
ncbi:hypothetical protein FACS189461_3740 [Spirochaetia bacterium]|nr:hypothetical protein FACS189461_3740 [Spirochaetia bacterium]